MAEKWKQPEINGYNLDEVVETFQYFQSHRKPNERIWKLIQDYYDGEFWKNIKKNLPKHQILPDTNYVRYTVDNITNSVYAGSYRAELMPRHYKDNDLAMSINSYIEHQWDKLGMKKIGLKVGSRATMFNVAGVQVGWDSNIIGGSSHYRYNGEVELKYIDVENLYLDPGVKDYLKGRALFIASKVTIFDLLFDKATRKGAKAYKAQMKDAEGNFESDPVGLDDGKVFGENKDIPNSKSVNLIEAYYKVETEDGYRIDRLMIADQRFLLAYTEGIEPNTFPIRLMYAQEPVGDPYGVPPMKPVLANNIAINMIDSIEATHGYASQNRTKLINDKSGINYRSFAKHGNTPNMAFPVHGNPDDVIRYVELQPLPNLRPLREHLEQSIMLTTGVDLRYTGRDTGSIQTTGGTDISQQRVIGMSDNTRIIMLEEFTQKLTQLVVDFYTVWGDKRPKVKRRAASNEVDAIDMENPNDFIDFESLEASYFDYTMQATPHLPKNRIRLAEAATKMLEMQGQYQFQPAIITHEEWLMWQNFPQRDLILQRIRGEKMDLDVGDMEATLLSFAGMIDKGHDAQDAINILAEEKQLKRDNPSMGAQGSNMQPPQPPMGGGGMLPGM